MMDQHPETLKKFLRAWFETVVWMKAHKAETVKYHAENDAKLSDDIAAKGYDRLWKCRPSSPTAISDRKKLAAVQQSLVDLKLIDKAYPEVLGDTLIVTEEISN